VCVCEREKGIERQKEREREENGERNHWPRCTQGCLENIDIKCHSVGDGWNINSSSTKVMIMVNKSD
jgi:hypothetical protein